jgi:L-aminopeptidase/D-esterase-like protein
VGSGADSSGYGENRVGVLGVVYAVVALLNARGEIIAGTTDSVRYLADGGAPLGEPERLSRNTTLAVIATNADIDRVALREVANAGSDALARRITPYGTLFDGDVIFAVSTATTRPRSALQVEALVALAVPAAVERAVTHG